MTTNPPPELPGYDYETELGSGGFADVYRYRQHRPSRQVAVKVLRKIDLSEHEQRQFENEINRMSSLSQHPGILTIYEADVTLDGRAYFSMEYCPHDHFGELAKTQPLSVARALEVGIKVAAAIETAHQAGILHRDIKPANILQTAYGEPALTDFGIAGGRDADADPTESTAVTIPFAAPEVLARRTLGDERSDVYSLAATIYALLAARAPFSTGRPMPRSEMINHILTGTPQPTGRADVPRELENALSTGLARQPESRFSSAASFGRALQTVEAALGFPQTALQVARPAAPSRQRLTTPSDDDGDTVFKPPARVDPSAPGTSSLRSNTPIAGVPTQFPSAPPPAGAPSSAASPGPALPIPDDIEADTIMRGGQPEAAGDLTPQLEDGPPGRTGPPVALLASVAAATILVLIVLAVLFLSGGDDDPAEAPTTTADATAFQIATPPSPPVDLDVSIEESSAVVTWAAVEPEDGDGYRVLITAGPRAGQSTNTTELEARLELEEGQDSICVQVLTIRGGQLSTPTQDACAP